MDYYEILEVETSATTAEIKKSYRKLALRYHPDKVNEEGRDEAEAKFKELTNAYEVLIDETKRHNYDLYGNAEGPNGDNGGGYGGYDDFYGGGGANGFGPEDFYRFFNGMGGDEYGYASSSPPKPAVPRTDDATIEVDVTLEDLFKGKVIKTTITRDILCTLCDGVGYKKNAINKQCPDCDGKGVEIKIKRYGPGIIRQESVNCTKCEGRGKIYRSKDKCKKCLGSRVQEETKIYEFEIKKGAHSGESIVLEGASDQAPGKQSGDIRLTYNCKPHDSFQRKGDDLYMKYKITLVELLSGFSKIVAKHLDGRALKITTPKGKVLRPGDFIKLKNEGMPSKKKSASWFSSSSSQKRGDLYIELEIEFPQDNWYLEKNDLVSLLNILPTKLQNKLDIEKQEIPSDCLEDANVEDISDIIITNKQLLPQEKEHHENGHGHGHRGQGSNGQPECPQQ
ncbi:uncharacterized protein KQ657_002347 [Scheffersomyces spartinae]|uniref:Uncharacterized protein n=1 Tax=Scheffersomyces spartinae TaxID=45513 RepID=A0A9P8AK01_9ASCO|nr:uncharacterized protein KQ657_002347 [Scheffersomyces spartinae]KAG7195960.1 hypothetical protein KQ657_002347 [Scheffersomyces spartinae]